MIGLEEGCISKMDIAETGNPVGWHHIKSKLSKKNLSDIEMDQELNPLGWC